MSAAPPPLPPAAGPTGAPADGGVDRENPWPGLTSFKENQRDFFFGRAAETAELQRLVRRETLTVLFGQSGLGKSSLLQAGLFPLLRQEDLLPVYIKLVQTGDAPPLAEQVIRSVVAQCELHGIEAPAHQPGETIWEWFHRRDAEFWNSKNRLVSPVIVLDQFEEIFTLGRNDDANRRRSQQFLVDFADLIENRPPAKLKEQFESGTRDAAAFDFEHIGFKCLLSLREDFLPELEGLRPIMRSVMQNRMRMRRMNGTQALDVIEKPGTGLVTRDVAVHIVGFVAAAGNVLDGGQIGSDRLAELEVEPALLSVVCRELNNKRLSLGQATITPDLLAGNRQEILADFYDRSVSDLSPQVRTFLEDRLLTKAGYRFDLPVENALAEPGISMDVIDLLVDRRLLRLDVRLGVQRVELTHDVLAQPIRTSRDARQHKLALADAEAREKSVRLQAANSRRRTLKYAAAAVVGVALPTFIGLSVWAIRREKAAQTSEQSAITSAAEAMDAKIKAMRSADDARQQQTIADAQRKDAEEQRKKAEQSTGRYYLEKVQTPLEGNTPDGVAARQIFDKGMKETHGALPHADLIRQLLPRTPFSAEQVLTFDRGVEQVGYSFDGRLLAVRTSDSKVHLFAQDGAQHQWAAKGPPLEAGSFAFHPSQPLLALRQADAGMLQWPYDQPIGAAVPMEIPPPKALPVETAKTDAAKPDAAKTEPPKAEPSLKVEPAKAAAGLATAMNRLDARQAEADKKAIPPLAYSPDGATLAVTRRDGSVVTLSATTAGGLGEKLADGAPPLVKDAAPAAADPKADDFGTTHAKSDVIPPANLPFPHAVVFESDGRVILTTALRNLRLWATGTLEQTDGVTSEDLHRPTSIAVAPDGLTMAVTPWKTSFNHLQFAPNLDCTRFETSSLLMKATVSAFSPDSRWLAVGTLGDGTALLDDEHFIQSLGQQGSIHAIAFRPDGAELSTGSTDKSVILWRHTPADPLFPLSVKVFDDVRTSPDGRVFAVTKDQFVQVYRAGQAAPTVVLLPAIAMALAVDNDGNVVAVSESAPPPAPATADGTAPTLRTANLQVWQSRTRQTMAIGGKGESVLRLSNDGRLLAAIDADNVIQVFDTTTGKNRVTIAPPTAHSDTLPDETGDFDPDAPVVDTIQTPVVGIAAESNLMAVYRPSTKTIELRQLDTGALKKSIEFLGGDPTDLAFADGGKTLLIACVLDGLTALDLDTETAFFHQGFQLASKLSVSDDGGVIVATGLTETDVFRRTHADESDEVTGRELNDATFKSLPLSREKLVDALKNRPVTPVAIDRAAFWREYWALQWDVRKMTLSALPPSTDDLKRMSDPLRPYVADSTLDFAEARWVRQWLDVTDPYRSPRDAETAVGHLQLIHTLPDSLQTLYLPGVIKALAPKSPDRAETLFALAAAYARLNKLATDDADKAFAYLNQAVDEGFHNWSRACDPEAFGGTLLSDERYLDEWLSDDALKTRAKEQLELNSHAGNQRAVKLFTRYLATNGWDSETWGSLATAQVRENDSDAAEKSLKKAINAADPAETLCTAYLQYANFLGKQERLKEAEDNFALAVDMDPDKPKALAARGQFHKDHQLWDAAIADYTEANRLDPQYNTQLAGVTFGKGDTAAAFQILEDYLKDKPTDDAQPWINAGTTVFSDAALDEKEKAIEYLQKAAQIGGDTLGTDAGITLYSRLGAAYRKLQRYDECKQALDKALQIDPQAPWPLAELGELQRRLGDAKQAIATLDSAISLNKKDDDPWAYARRGDARLMLDDVDGALQDYADAVRIDPGVNRRLQVAVLIELKRYDEARKAAALVRDSVATRSLGQYQLGLIDRLQGNGDGKALFQSVADGTATGTAGLEARGKAFAYLGTYDRAVADAAEVKRTAESDPNATDPDLGGNATFAAIYAIRAASIDAQPSDRAKAIYFAGMKQITNPDDAFQLSHWPELQTLADDRLFQRLLDATKVPLSEPDRYLKLAAFEALLGADPKGDNALACELEIGPLLDRAKALGWDPAVPLAKDPGNDLLAKSKPFHAVFKTPATAPAK